MCTLGLQACSLRPAVIAWETPRHIGRPCPHPLRRCLDAGGMSSTQAPGNNDSMLECRGCPDQRISAPQCPSDWPRPKESKDLRRKCDSWQQRLAERAVRSRLLEQNAVAGSTMHHVAQQSMNQQNASGTQIRNLPRMLVHGTVFSASEHCGFNALGYNG